MQAVAIAKMLKVLSTERRVQILDLLLNSPDALPLTTINHHLGIEIDGPVSANLKAMIEVGLVLKTPSGRYVFFEPNRVAIDELRSFFTPIVQEKGKPVENL